METDQGEKGETDRWKIKIGIIREVENLSGNVL